jgi:phosphoglycolate phosphatase
MPSASRSVLLDLDGTLIDSRPGIVASLNEALVEMGHTPDPDRDLTFFIGPPIAEAITRLLAHYGDDRVADGVRIYRAHYAHTGILGCELYPGIPEVVTTLQARGYALYVATSKLRAFAQAILERLELAGMMRGIYGSEPGGALDHKPALLAHVLAREPIVPERAVMIGDRRHDVEGAHANRMRAIGVLWGYGGREELTSAGADALAGKPGELADLVQALVEANLRSAG